MTKEARKLPGTTLSPWMTLGCDSAMPFFSQLHKVKKINLHLDPPASGKFNIPAHMSLGDHITQKLKVYKRVFSAKERSKQA